MSDFPAVNLGNTFKQPAPLQPAALVRTDDDGMYVAVGGAGSLGLGHSPITADRHRHAPLFSAVGGSNPISTTTTPSRGVDGDQDNNNNNNSDIINNNNNKHDDDDDGSGLVNTPQANNRSNNNDNSRSMSPPIHRSSNNNVRDGRGTFHSEAVIHAGIKTLSTPRGVVGSYQNYQQQRQAAGGNGSGATGTTTTTTRDAFIYGAGRSDNNNSNNNHHSARQPWLSGWTLGCSNHTPTCLDGFCCPWCVHGMQWKRLHESAEARRERLQHAKFVNSAAAYEAERASAARARAAAGDLDLLMEQRRKERDDIATKRRETGTIASAATRGGGGRAGGGSELPAGTVEDEQARAKRLATEQEEILRLAKIKQEQQRRRELDAFYYQNDPAYRHYYDDVSCLTRCGDRCEQVDWLCCMGTCFLDLIGIPLFLSPFGSAIAQHHIRQAARIKYNLVPAPGSMTEEEQVERRDTERLAKMKHDNRRQERAARAEASRKFNERFPDAKRKVDGDGASPGVAAAGDASGMTREELDLLEQDKADQAEDEALRKQYDSSLSSGICSDESKEILYSWCCCPCSVAQVQREMSLRQDYPGGFFSQPLRPPRRSTAAALSAAEMTDEMVMMMSDELATRQRGLLLLSPQRERNSLANQDEAASRLMTTTSSSVSAMQRAAPPPPSSSHLAPPPPTPNESRHLGARPTAAGGAGGADSLENSSNWMTSKSMMQPTPGGSGGSAMMFSSIRPSAAAAAAQSGEEMMGRGEATGGNGNANGLPSSRMRPTGNSVFDIAGRAERR